MRKFKNFILWLYMMFFSLFFAKKNQVVFRSFSGRAYSDNTRAISEKLHELYPTIKIIWIYNGDKAKVPNYVNIVNSDRVLEVYKTITLSKVYVDNFCLTKVIKSKKQLFIQTWHGDRAFKKVLYDSYGENTKIKLGESIPGYCDYAIAGSKYGEKQYRTAFRYNGQVILNGTPRNDILVNGTEKIIMEYKQNIVNDDCKLLLYAPTLRDVSIRDKSAVQNINDLDITKTLDCLEKKHNCRWKCLMRAHPSVASLSGAKKEDDRIVDVSAYEDMSHLMLISDMLITDYSSCAGDFALTGRSLILFHSDIEEYKSTSREFYFDMNESPYFIAKTQEELESIIENLSESIAKQNCKEILDFYVTTESGKASECVANIINEWITNKR